MHDSVSIDCPHCGEAFTIPFDLSEGSTEFTYDCEVCCRPIKVFCAVGETGEIESLDVAAE